MLDVMASIVARPDQAQAARALLGLAIAAGHGMLAAPPEIVSYARVDAP